MGERKPDFSSDSKPHAADHNASVRTLAAAKFANSMQKRPQHPQRNTQSSHGSNARQRTLAGELLRKRQVVDTLIDRMQGMASLDEIMATINKVRYLFH